MPSAQGLIDGVRVTPTAASAWGRLAGVLSETGSTKTNVRGPYGEWRERSTDD